MLGTSAFSTRMEFSVTTGPRDLALTNTRSDWEEIGRLWRYFAKRRIWGELRWLAPTNACSEQSATLPLSRFAGWTPELGHPMKGRRQRLADRSGKRRLARRGAWQMPDAPHA